MPRENEGTTALRQEHGKQEWFAEARANAHAKAGDPGRRAKIAAARKGKPRTPEVVEAMRAARLGKPLSEVHLKKLSEGQRRRRARPPKTGRPWTRAEDDLLRTLPASEVAQRTGRTLSAVYSRRVVLGLPDGRRR